MPKVPCENPGLLKYAASRSKYEFGLGHLKEAIRHCENIVQKQDRRQFLDLKVYLKSPKVHQRQMIFEKDNENPIQAYSDQKIFQNHRD